MQTKYLTVSSWSALAIAIASWCGVAFFLITVLQMQSDRVAYVEDAANANLQQGQAAKLRVLARETQDDRSSLESAANVDVLSAVNLIESVNVSGTPVHVTGAQPIKNTGTAKSGTRQMNIVDLSVNSQGSFSSLMRIAQMLEALPLPTSVQEIEITRSPVDPNAKNPSVSWTLNIRLRFYTTSALST